MHSSIRHRGPDASDLYFDENGQCGIAHNRLSIIDLSEAGRQPIVSTDGNYVIALNGEIYNYLELRRELESEFTFQTRTDTEVLLNSYIKWGPAALDRLIGMFAFVIWNKRDRTAFVARDRFGVKPMYYHRKPDGTLFLGSEIKALHAGGIDRKPEPSAWARYLASGLTDDAPNTFWQGVNALGAGEYLTWKDGRVEIRKWYDLADRVSDETDERRADIVEEEYRDLLLDSVRLRFRSDVPVGINLSGGLDSSTLLGVVHAIEKEGADVAAYTFTTGDDRYDEVPWVREMLRRTQHPLFVSELRPDEVPGLAASVQHHQDEPFGGIPTLAYAKLFTNARENGSIVLLDGNGMDEQWAGYDYYRNGNGSAPVVQGVSASPLRPECLVPDFRSIAEKPLMPDRFSDRLRNLQYRDTTLTKIPRAMRYNDRVSMRASTELREPFLDHRLFELAFRQPEERKIKDGVGKHLLRRIGRSLVPDGIALAPKRPVQTPQREWLRGELAGWADDRIEAGLASYGGSWLDAKAVRREWGKYLSGGGDNSFYIWQWINLGLAAEN